MSDQAAGALDPIAVIGLAGRFPGARSVDELWRNLIHGVESITAFREEELRRAGVPEHWLTDPRYVRANGVLADVELFDAEFFEFTPREAEITDPQQRILLECAWESLENAGYDPDRFPGRIGVYAGAGISTYLLRNIMSRSGLPPGVSELQILMGNNKDYVPTRISYKLNLKGPSINVSTACSTSLVAVHLACQALLDYHCDIALAGGVGIQVPQRQGYWHEDGGIGSPDGHCRAFDARAAGTVSGNGAGIVVLKRLADAWKDGDCIRAIIRGSAVNNDGRAKAGYTAPSIQGQADVVAEALALAGVAADDIGYVEAHGTGTALGDPIELTALAQAFGSGRGRKQFCAIGSVKTNIGHLDEAAGVAGLIKTVCALEHGTIPPSLHFEQSNPNFDLAASPFFVNTRLARWTASPRRAGVSSFGIGGTNAHAVLEEAPARPPSQTERRWHVLPLSTRSRSALDTATSNLAARLREQERTTGTDPRASAAWLADTGYTLGVGRKPFPHRRVLVSSGLEAAATALETGDASVTFTNVSSDEQPRPVVFLCPGQGAQYPRMALHVYRHERGFRACLDECAERLRPAFGYDFRAWLYPADGADADKAAAALRRTAYAQPVLFAVEYALARLLIDWGVRPQAMIGHSLGEYVAASLAGVFSLDEGLKLVAARGALMESLEGGAMLALQLSEAESRAMLPHDIWIAACNGPSLTTVSGRLGPIQAFHRHLLDRGIGSHLLATAHGFHSPLMEPILPGLLERFREVRLRPPTMPYLSNLTGDWITPDQATDPMYWVAHSRQPVRFADALEKVFTGGQPILLEVGPGRTLTSAALQHPKRSATEAVYTTLPHPRDPDPDDKVLLSAIGQLWTHGVPIDWAAFHAEAPRYRVPLPTYPFDRQRYWIAPGDPGTAESAASVQSPSVEKTDDLSRWFYVPSWRRSMLPARATAPEAERWLLFVDDLGVGARLADRLTRAGGKVTTVSARSAFARVAEGEFAIDPRERAHYISLVTELTAGGARLGRVVHLWSLGADRQPSSWRDTQDRGFYSLLFLAQAVRTVSSDEPVTIDVVSNGLHDVIGGEPLVPATATTLGPVKVIPQECPNITCRSIDLALEAADASRVSRQVDRLYQELVIDAPDRVIAWRGPHRWTQRFEPLDVELTTRATSRLKVGGTYLITGGLGGVGTILAEYLARRWKARLALLGRANRQNEPLPAVTPDAEPVAAADDGTAVRERHRLVLADRAGAISTAADRIASDISAHVMADYPGFTRAIHQLCVAYIYEYFCTAMRSGLRRGQIWSRHELNEALHILPRFARFVDFFLDVLSDASLVRCTSGGAIEILKDAAELSSAESTRAAILRQFPGFAGIVSLLDHCVRQYPAALSGEIEPIAVLYPEGSSALLEAAGRSTTLRGYRDVYIAVLREIVDEVCRRPSGPPIRILEVGVGDGILARAVAPHLPRHRVEYWATDIGRTFVVRAEQEAAAAGLDFMRFAILDIANGPLPAEIEPGSFDFILGLDVVHATPRIQGTLGRLHDLLVPGGVLALIESVGAQPWVDMIWGLADGWWSFEDDDLRKDSPLLGLSQWEAVLQRSGFESAQAHPADAITREQADYGLILGQKPLAPELPAGAPAPDLAVERREHGVERLRTLGAEVLVLSADVGDEAQMTEAVARVRQRFGRIDGVIHAAGVTSADIVFNLVEDTTRRTAEALFRSKIQGSIVLARVLRDEPLDFCLLISSNAAILGGLGFSAYAASNLFMDAFATAHRQQSGQRWISANWDGWPTEEIAGGAARFQTSIDRFAMTRSECERAFETVLAQPSPHVVVSSADLDARLRFWTSRPTRSSRDAARAQEAATNDARSSEAGPWKSTDASSLHRRPQLSTEYLPPTSTTEKALCRIWQELFAIERIGVDDNFFELRGDSLLATQLVATASKELNVRVPIRAIFEHASVSQLAKAIEEIEGAVTLLNRVPANRPSSDEEEGSI